MNRKLHYKSQDGNCYRYNVDGLYSDLFGQIKREGRDWLAEIRYCSTGRISRYAGIWNTRKDAEEEIEHILTFKPLSEMFTK